MQYNFISIYHHLLASRITRRDTMSLSSIHYMNSLQNQSPWKMTKPDPHPRDKMAILEINTIA